MSESGLSFAAEGAAALRGRLEQAFPELGADEIARMRRFGEVRSFAAGETVYERGKTHSGLVVVLKGTIGVTAPGCEVQPFANELAHASMNPRRVLPLGPTAMGRNLNHAPVIGSKPGAGCQPASRARRM